MKWKITNSLKNCWNFCNRKNYRKNKGETSGNLDNKGYFRYNNKIARKGYYISRKGASIKWQIIKRIYLLMPD